MKVISVILAAAMAAQAAPPQAARLWTVAAEKNTAPGPDKAAIDFLEKVRTRTLDLEPGGDTALTDQTAAEKRRQIAKRMERMARDLGSDPLEVGAMKQDENFAAVLIHKVGGFDPGRLQVFPVALVRRDSKWEVAPVPGSFENSGAGYALALQKRLEQLENWMLREQVVDLEKLRVQTNKLIRQKIEAKLPEAELRKLDMEQTANLFLTACETGDQATLLGVLGGLGTPQPDDWSLRLKSAENAIAAGAASPRPWRLLTAPDVARVVVAQETDGSTGRISIGCLDPAGVDGAKPRVEVIHLPLSKSRDGLWRVDPPAAYLRGPRKANTDAPAEPEAGGTADMIQLFASGWSKKHPSTPQPSAEAAAQAWLAALHGDSFASFLALSRLDVAAADSARACGVAARLWQSIHGGATDFIIPVAFKEEESRAAGIYQFFTAHDPDRLDTQPVYFEKSPEGWLCAPQPLAESEDGFKAWVGEQSRKLPDEWQGQMLAGCPVLTDLAALDAPTEEEARKCVEEWLAAVHRGDVNAAIHRIALLDTPRSGASAVQNLGYEIAAARDRPETPPVLSTYQAKPWAAAGIKIEGKGGKSTFPLYPVVKTSQGPRVLVEIDLVSAGNRGRDFLNNAVLNKLGKSSSDEVETALRGLLQQHQARMEKMAEKTQN